MTKKSIYYCLVLLFLFFFWSSIADAYKVNSYRTSEEGWGEKTTQFTTNSEAVYINVGTSTDFADEGVFITFKWYRPDGSLEDDIGTNLLAQRVYRSGLLVGFWTYMVIKGKDRELGQWRVEHWARGYKGGVLDWYLMFTAYFTIASGLEPPAPELPTYDATGIWEYSTYNQWTDCPGGSDSPETGSITLTQTKNRFTSVEDGRTYTGSVSGVTYTYTASYPAEDGTVTETTTFTLSSGTSGSGATTWEWTDGADSCIGGHDFSMTKYEHLTLSKPNGGEIIPSGSGYFIEWEAEEEVETFKLKYSMDNGATWEKIADNILGMIYPWEVPTPNKNKANCLIKVIGYDASGKIVGKDTSDDPFTIEVLTVTSPTDGDTLTSGETHTITWTTNETKAEVAKVKLLYTKNAGKIWKKIDVIDGYNPETYMWTVPDVPKTKGKCRVKVVLKDENGKTVAKAISDGFFTIEP